MGIPTNFQLVNRKYTVEEMDKDLSDDLKALGDCDRFGARIRVCLDNPDNAEHTFYHELAHALLYATTKPKLSDKEDFVDSLGAAIHQYMQTKKGKLV